MYRTNQDGDINCMVEELELNFEEGSISMTSEGNAGEINIIGSEAEFGQEYYLQSPIDLCLGRFAPMNPAETVENDVMKVSFYPNPASQELTVESLNLPENSRLELHSVSGQILLQTSLLGESTVLNFDLPGGIYTLRIVDVSGITLHSERILIQP